MGAAKGKQLEVNVSTTRENALVATSGNYPNVMYFPTDGDSIIFDGKEWKSSSSSINAATSTDLGGIKIGYEENGNNYPVNLDENYRAYVTVANNSSVYVFPNTFIVGGYATSSELGDYEDFKNAFDNNHVIIGKYQTSDGGYTGYLVFSFAQSDTSAPKFYGTALSEDGTKSYLLTLNCTSDSWSSRTRVATLEEVSMGGSEVSFSRTLSTGTIIGTITIDGTATDIYAPTAGESVSYSQATSDTLGLVKIGYSTNDDDRNYAVELNSDGQMFVNVPWESGSESVDITGGASTIVTANLTANRALVSNSSGKVAVSAVTSTELGYLDGVTSNIQTQLNGKQSSLAGVTTNAIAVWDSSGNFTYDSSIDINVIQNISSSGGYVYVLTNSNGANVAGGIERAISQIGMAYDGNISRDTSGLFDTVDAANGIITLKTNGAGYYYQIGASSNGKLYHRYLGNASAGDSKWTSTSWSECADVNSANTFTGNNTFSGSNTFTGTNTFTAYADFTAGAGNSGSDMRFKSGVIPLRGITDDLMRIKVIKYTWNHPDENKCRYTFGVNADDLLGIGGVCASIVHVRDDKYATKWVEYDRIGVIALAGLQETNRLLEEKCKRYEKVLVALADKLEINIDEVLKEE